MSASWSCIAFNRTSFWSRSGTEGILCLIFYWVMESTLHYAVCISHAILIILLYQHARTRMPVTQHSWLCYMCRWHSGCQTELVWIPVTLFTCNFSTCKPNAHVETLDPFGGFLGLWSLGKWGSSLHEKDNSCDLLMRLWWVGLDVEKR